MLTIPDDELLRCIRTRLREAAEPARAPQMQAYMKSAMPYLGVRLPEVRRLTLAESTVRPFAAFADFADTVRTLWRSADFREERYAATALCDTPSARALRRPELLGQLLDLYRDLIVDGAWWDHVDELAHRVGQLLMTWPDIVTPTMYAWSTADDHWLRRTAIIGQLGRKRATDVGLLSHAIDVSATESDFFLRKAIGWALRDYARTDPDWVRAFVAGRTLSPLSEREALKHL